ncbi:hypothetical protein [Rhodoferax sp.]|uniref:hypothetical protein n=1 Tax=Rhodoferax sp. TaxID=50421 RepID=UPI002777DD0D|nr:hypothetical protein [Rhodoferax sp.]
MSHIATYFHTPSDLTHALVTACADALARWRQLPRAQRVSVWQCAAVSLVVLGLLVAFHQVVSGVVEQAALQRQSLARNTTETLRCKALPGQPARAHCLSQVLTRVAPEPAAPGRLLAAGGRHTAQ